MSLKKLINESDPIVFATSLVSNLTTNKNFHKKYLKGQGTQNSLKSKFQIRSVSFRVMLPQTTKIIKYKL